MNATANPLANYTREIGRIYRDLAESLSLCAWNAGITVGLTIGLLTCGRGDIALLTGTTGVLFVALWLWARHVGFRSARALEQPFPYEETTP